MTERPVPYSYGGPGCDGTEPCDARPVECCRSFTGDYYEYGERVLAEAKAAASTPRGRLFANHDKLCSTSKELMVAKNRDYATDDDPFRNFRMFGALGILVRMSDKLARMRNYVENGKFVVSDEGLWDTARDMVNYTNILLSYLEEEERAAR